MTKLALHWQIFIGLILGIIFGLLAHEYVEYVGWMGTLFIRILNMIVIPLILTSIVTGVAGLGGGPGFRKMGGKTIAYYLTTSIFAILIGSTIMNVFQPGVGFDLNSVEMSAEDQAKIEKLEKAEESFSFKDRIISIAPVNIFKAMAEGDTLAIIFFAILLGIFIPKLSDPYRESFLHAFKGGFELIMKITLWVIKLTPLGIFGLMAATIAEQTGGDINKLIAMLSKLGTFAVLVIGGLLFHAFVTLFALLTFVGRINPIKHLKAMLTPLITAFSTSSSGATMPLTLEALEKNSGVSTRTTSFVIPLGATINMDGTALYEIAGTLFIAQAYGLDLDFGQQILIIITALLASIGAAAIPMAGLIMMTVILSAIGLPTEAIAIMFVVDRILDMFRTAVNVWSDTCGTVIIAKSEGEVLNYE